MPPSRDYNFGTLIIIVSDSKLLIIDLLDEVVKILWPNVLLLCARGNPKGIDPLHNRIISIQPLEGAI